MYGSSVGCCRLGPLETAKHIQSLCVPTVLYPFGSSAVGTWTRPQQGHTCEPEQRRCTDNLRNSYRPSLPGSVQSSDILVEEAIFEGLASGHRVLQVRARPPTPSLRAASRPLLIVHLHLDQNTLLQELESSLNGHSSCASKQIPNTSQSRDPTTLCLSEIFLRRSWFRLKSHDASL